MYYDNTLNSTIKRLGLSEWVNKQDPSIVYFQEIPPTKRNEKEEQQKDVVLGNQRERERNQQ